MTKHVSETPNFRTGRTAFIPEAERPLLAHVPKRTCGKAVRRNSVALHGGDLLTPEKARKQIAMVVDCPIAGETLPGAIRASSLSILFKKRFAAARSRFAVRRKSSGLPFLP